MKSRQIYVYPHILFYVHNILRVKATESNTLVKLLRRPSVRAGFLVFLLVEVFPFYSGK